MRYLLDENLLGFRHWIDAHNQRSSLALDVVCIGDASDLPRGSSDPEVLAWAEREGRILLTLDRNTMVQFLAEHLQAGHHSPGVFLVRPHASWHDTIEFLVAAAHASDATEWMDRVEYIP